MINLSLTVVSSGIASIPILMKGQTEGIKYKFLSIVCFSFVIAGIYFLLESFMTLPMKILAIQTIFWSMLLASFISWFFKKEAFFYSLVSVPCSLLIAFFIWRGSIFTFGAIVSVFMLAEVLVYILFKGNPALRYSSTFGLIASTLIIIYFYPAQIAEDYRSILILIAYLFTSSLLIVFFYSSYEELRSGSEETKWRAGEV